MGTQKFNNLESCRYADLRERIQTGDILFASGDYLISKLIRKASGSALSHAAFIYWLEDRLTVVESVEGAGVRMIPLSKYVQDYNRTGRPYHGRLFVGRLQPALSHEQVKSIIGATADLLANPFSVSQFLKIWVRWYFGLGKDKDDPELVCSEFVCAAFRKAGFDFNSAAPDDYVFPETIGAHDRVVALFEIVP